MLLRVNQNDKILVVAPHPDDETIGCGGLLVKYGAQCDVLLITDGRMGFFEKSSVTNPDEMAKIRKREFRRVMNILHVNNYFCLNLPNGNLKSCVPEIKKVDITKYSLIFIPGINEHHEEHVLVNKVLWKMIVSQQCSAAVYEYEVWTPMLNPTKMLDISDVIDKKTYAVSQYFSQLECYDYVNLCKSLNQFRGCTHNIHYAEMYMRRLTPREKLKKHHRKARSIFEKQWSVGGSCEFFSLN